MKSNLEKAISIVGNQTLLANAIGVKQSYVWNWLNRSNGKVPVLYCLKIERATQGQVTRRDLRPDDWQSIWPELAEISEIEKEAD